VNNFSSPNYNLNGDFDRLQNDYELFYDDEGYVTQFIFIYKMKTKN
jgi:hypothetical protein